MRLTFEVRVRGLRESLAKTKKIRRFFYTVIPSKAEELRKLLVDTLKNVIRKKFAGRETEIERSVRGWYVKRGRVLTFVIQPMAKHAKWLDKGTGIFGPKAQLRPYRYVPFVGMKEHVSKEIRFYEGGERELKVLAGRLLQAPWVQSLPIAKDMKKLAELNKQISELKWKIKVLETYGPKGLKYKGRKKQSTLSKELRFKLKRLKEEAEVVRARVLDFQERLAPFLKVILEKKGLPRIWYHPKLKLMGEYGFWHQAKHLGLTERGVWYRHDTKWKGARLSPKWEWKKKKPPKDYGTWRGFPGKFFMRDFGVRAQPLIERFFAGLWARVIK